MEEGVPAGCSAGQVERSSHSCSSGHTAIGVCRASARFASAWASQYAGNGFYRSRVSSVHDVAVDIAAVIASCGTAAVGIAGIVATHLAGRRQQQTAVEVARVQIQSQERLALEERKQQRLEAIYDRLLTEFERDEGAMVGWRGRDDPDFLMRMSVCMSGSVDRLVHLWSSEPDPHARREIARRARNQMRRELIGQDDGASLQPYTDEDPPPATA